MTDKALASTDRLLKAREVASLLGLGVRTVWRLASAGEIPRPIAVGQSARWLESELKAWIKERQAGRPYRYFRKRKAGK